jgi:hypothetical protein
MRTCETLALEATRGARRSGDLAFRALQAKGVALVRIAALLLIHEVEPFSSKVLA